MSKLSQGYTRPAFHTALARLGEPRRFIQVLAGPRQTGKTILAHQLMQAAGLAAHYASADDPSLRDRIWIEAQWDHARRLAREGPPGALLVLDEVQKIGGWSEVVKRLWDEDSASGSQLRVLLLGSAPLLVQRGLTESLAGRFELIRVSHWSFEEMREAFGFGIDEHVYFGGYPGAAALIADRERWAAYLLDSLVETTLSRDVLLLTRVDKPALLRQLFRLGCDYSGQILSYQKMLGQLQDAGSTVTLAHYLELLAGAGMVAGLQKHSGSRARRRGSSPKLVALNTGLIAAQLGRGLEGARGDGALWGRLVESAVGAHLVNASAGTGIEVSWWRERGREVDYVLRRGESLTAIEVKGGRQRGSRSGLEAFGREHGGRKLLVGGDGVPLEELLLSPPDRWLG